MAKKEAQAVSARWLLHVPKRYMDFTSPKNVFPLPDGAKHLISCRLKEKRGFAANGRSTSNCREMARLSLTFEDDRGNTAKSMVFGAVWAWRSIEVESRVNVYAKTSYWNDLLQLDQPDIIQPESIGKVHAQYAADQGDAKVTGGEVTEAVHASLILLDEAAQMLLEALKADEHEFRELFGIAPSALLREMHCPLSVDRGLECITITQDVVTEVIIRRAERNSVIQHNPRSAIPVDEVALTRFIAALPFPLTGDQKRSVREIVADLRSNLPMRRMLVGDVGTGKSLAFMLPASAATLAGGLCAIITPNQLLVDQLAREMGEMFPSVPVQVIRPGGKIVPGGGLVIGTTSVLFAADRGDVVFDFVVTDEEHKFSVDQKQAIADGHTNLLRATATPIPRSIALIACDGMALSTLEECPVVKDVQSLLISAEKKKDLLGFIAKMSVSGQVAIVYPAVMESDKVKSIEENVGKWEKLFPGQVAVLHGQMPIKEKQAALKAMLEKKKSILVASTAIEIGVTLPDLKALIVVNPEMFGVSQLHQLRGRVARHGGVGYFVMYCPDASIAPESLERLNLVKTINNGFQLAEKDMESRGFGDLDITGETQTGQGRLLFKNMSISVKRIIFAMSSRRNIL